MPNKVYTITENGSSNGNVISQPFTIEVHQISYVSDGQLDAEGNPIEYMAVSACTKNGAGECCANDDISDYNHFETLPGMGSSKNADLASANNFESLLEAAYPGKWS